jgi:hypothetical protein
VPPVPVPVPIEPLVPLVPEVPLVPLVPPVMPLPLVPLALPLPLVPIEPVLEAPLELLVPPVPLLPLVWWDLLLSFFCFLLELVVPLLELPEVWSLACAPVCEPVRPDALPVWSVVLLVCALTLNEVAIAAATEAPSRPFKSLCIFMFIS